MQDSLALIPEDQITLRPCLAPTSPTLILLLRALYTFLWALLPHLPPPQLYTPARADIFYATLLFTLKRSSGTTAQHFRHITLRLVSTVAAQTLDINGVREVYSSLRLLHLRRSSVTIDPHQATSPPLVCPDSSSRDTQIRRQFGGSSILPFHPTLNERSARPFSCLCFSTSTNI